MITILAGGTGGAKLARGFASVLPPGELHVVVNTGDDCSFYGLRVSPDVDMAIYTLAGLLNQVQGWGLYGDTSAVAERLQALGENLWFNLGDQDLAVQLLRNAWYEKGGTPTGFARWLGETLGINAVVLPMTDDHVETRIVTKNGDRHFEEYLLKDRGCGTVQKIWFQGAEVSRPTVEVLTALRESNVIIFGPSNPLVSIGPILALPDVREVIENSSALKIAISPIVGGKVIKGPLASMMLDLGMEPSSFTIAGIYEGLIHTFVLDKEDSEQAQRIKQKLNTEVITLDTRMTDKERETALASDLLEYVDSRGAVGGWNNRHSTV